METGTTPSSASRRYDATRRQAEADERRRRVVEAGRRLFLEEGYGATSIKAIAEAAGVSAPTVYAQFESKAGVLGRVVDVAVAGDHEDAGPARHRPEVAAIYEPGALPVREHIRAAVAAVTAVHARSAPVLAIVESVAGADDAVRALHEQLQASMYQDARIAGSHLDPDELRPGLDLDALTRILATVGGPHVYHVLTTDFGLTDAQYEDWLVQSLTHLLVPDERAGSSS
jgi:AcrR family transcriptional regulator